MTLREEVARAIWGPYSRPVGWGLVADAAIAIVRERLVAKARDEGFLSIEAIRALSEEGE